ncbi:hypothetical protein ACOSQ2_016510 [Xanthoceras sorbifolium]
MDRRTFTILCELLRNTRRLKTNGLVSVKEQVCIFLHVLAHHVKNQTIRNRFRQSGETICRYFNSVLCAVLQLHNDLLVSPTFVPENCTDKRWKWFNVSNTYNYQLILVYDICIRIVIYVYFLILFFKLL